MKDKFPPGWNEARVKNVIAHYVAQSEEEAVAEDEAVFETEGPTLMRVPSDLVSKLRELIAQHSA